MVKATTATTQMTVFDSTVDSAGCCSTARKLRVPALPLRRPVTVNRSVDAWTSLIAGKSTTPMINARAGPSQIRVWPIPARPRDGVRRRFGGGGATAGAAPRAPP